MKLLNSFIVSIVCIYYSIITLLLSYYFLDTNMKGEVLEAANVSWKIYQQADNFDDNAFAWFNAYQKSRPG